MVPRDTQRGESYRLEVVWGAVPGILASTAPHCSGFPAEETGLVDQRNSIHYVFQGMRGEERGGDIPEAVINRMFGGGNRP